MTVDTPPGRLMQEWLENCRKPDLARQTAWLNLHLDDAKGAADIARQDTALCKEQGGFAFLEVVESRSNKIHILVQAVQVETYFQLALETNDKGKLARFGIWLKPPPEAALPTDLSDAAIAREVSRRVDKLARAGVFSGVVAVARDGRIFASASGGFANRENKTPITLSTPFTIASMGKMFTTVAVGQLVEQGKMRYEDTVGKFFPEYPNPAARDEISVGMLLSHTSGMGDFLGKITPAMHANGTVRAQEFMPLYATDEVSFAPGSQWSYSNAGVALVGAIVEKISGQTYADYLKAQVFAPAGMRDSNPNNLPKTNKQLVVPYTRVDDKNAAGNWKATDIDLGSPAGGAVSTVGDLVRFARALLDGKLVTISTFEEITKPHGVAATEANYGYAMQIEDMYGIKIVGHTGGRTGVSTSLHMLPATGEAVVVLTNIDPPAESNISLPLVAMLAEREKRKK